MIKDHMIKNYFVNVSVICDILLLWCMFCKHVQTFKNYYSKKWSSIFEWETF